MASISQNQYNYLTNLTKGGGGNAQWAKEQLKGTTVAKPITPTSTTSNTTPITPKTNTTPITPTYNKTPTTNTSPGLGGIASGVAAAASTASKSTTTPSSPTFTPLPYGSDIINFDQSVDPQKQIADIGDEWAKAKTAGASKATLDAIHAKAAAIGGANGGTFNSRTGTWTFATPAPTPVPDPTPAPVPVPTGSPRQDTAYDPGTFKNDMTDLINQQTANAYAAQLAKLQELRDQQLLGLKGQEDLSNQNADSEANKASAANAVAAQRLKERMASMGLLDSGYNLENISDLSAQRQDALGSIEQQRSNNKQAIEEQKAQINNAVAKGDLALLQDLQAKQAQQLIDLGYNVDSREFQNVQYEWNKIMQEAGVTGNYNGQRTLAGAAQDWGKTVDMANLTGQFNGQQTMAGRQADWNAAKDVWDASGRMVNPNQNWGSLITQSQSNKAPLTQAAQQTKINNLWQSAQQTGYISNELADAVGLPRGTTTLAAQQLLLDQDRNQQGWAGLDIKQSDAANGGSTKTLFTAGQLMNNVQDGLVTKTTVWDANQGQYVTHTTPVTDSNSRYNVYKQTILSGNGFTDAQMDAILAAGGFTPAEINAFQTKLSKEYGLGG